VCAPRRVSASKPPQGTPRVPASRAGAPPRARLRLLVRPHGTPHVSHMAQPAVRLPGRTPTLTPDLHPQTRARPQPCCSLHPHHQADPMSDQGWWLCPNDPPCAHGEVLHDVDEYQGDGTETCCVEGCDCRGRPTARMSTTSTDENCGACCVCLGGCRVAHEKGHRPLVCDHQSPPRLGADAITAAVRKFIDGLAHPIVLLGRITMNGGTA
jgi:hypothetical protein